MCILVLLRFLSMDVGVGIHREPDHLMSTLRRLRRQMDIIVSEVCVRVCVCCVCMSKISVKAGIP